MKNNCSVPRLLMLSVGIMMIAIGMSCSKNNDVTPTGPTYPTIDFGDITSIPTPSLRFVPQDKNIVGGPAHQSDGDYIFLGFDSDAILNISKVSPTFDLKWSTTVGTNQQFWGVDSKKMPDGGFLLFGRWQKIVHTSIIRQSYVIKLDSVGNIEWQKGYDDIEGGCLDLVVLDDDSYLIAGYVGAQAYVRRIDAASGEEIWGYTFKDGSRTMAFSICSLPNRQFMISGINNNEQFAEHIAVLLDDSGTELQRTKFGRVKFNSEFPLSDEVKISTASTGCMVIGNIENEGDEADLLISYLNSIGEEQWTKAYGGTGEDLALSIFEDAANSGNLILATTENSSAQQKQLLLLKIDANGNWVWGKQYEGITSAEILALPSGGYLLTGNSQDPNDNIRKVFMLELDENGDPL